ncbi:MAG: response regulator [bacterium]
MEKKILVVDDSSFMRMSLKDILIKAGYNVDEATDGNACIEQVKAGSPDLVTMDVIMPGKDGIETLKELVELNKKIRVIMVTATGEEQKVIDAMSAGAKGYITKPFKPKDVIGAIQKALE